MILLTYPQSLGSIRRIPPAEPARPLRRVCVPGHAFGGTSLQPCPVLGHLRREGLKEVVSAQLRSAAGIGRRLKGGPVCGAWEMGEGGKYEARWSLMGLESVWALGSHVSVCVCVEDGVDGMGIVSVEQIRYRVFRLRIMARLWYSVYAQSGWRQ